MATCGLACCHGAWTAGGALNHPASATISRTAGEAAPARGALARTRGRIDSPCHVQSCSHPPNKKRTPPRIFASRCPPPRRRLNRNGDRALVADTLCGPQAGHMLAALRQRIMRPPTRKMPHPHERGAQERPHLSAPRLPRAPSWGTAVIAAASACLVSRAPRPGAHHHRSTRRAMSPQAARQRVCLWTSFVMMRSCLPSALSARITSLSPPSGSAYLCVKLPSGRSATSSSFTVTRAVGSVAP
jgi:hypothetical protein